MKITVELGHVGDREQRISIGDEKEGKVFVQGEIEFLLDGLEPVRLTAGEVLESLVFMKRAKSLNDYFVALNDKMNGQ